MWSRAESSGCIADSWGSKLSRWIINHQVIKCEWCCQVASFFFLSFFLLPLFQRFTPTRRSIEDRRWLVFGAAVLIEELARFTDLRLHERSQPLWKALWDKYFISRPPSVWKCWKWDWCKSGKQTQPYLITFGVCCILFIFYFCVSEPSAFLTLICCAREGEKK